MNDVLMLLATGVLAQDGPRQTGPDFGKASPFGLVVIVLLLVAVFGLVWSMNRHLRRLPKSFDDEDPVPGGPDADPDVPGPRATGGPVDGTNRDPDRGP